MPIVSHQDSILMKRIEKSILNRFSSFEVMPSIRLSRWLVTHSVSAKLQVVPSVSASDRRI